MFYSLIVYAYLFPDCINKFCGSNCSTKFRYCLKNKPCDKMTGACRHGCKYHFKDPHCQSRTEKIGDIKTK